MKTKRERFETVAAKRVQRVIEDLELLAKCANKNNYEYNRNDVQKMMSVIKIQVRKVDELYSQSLSSKKHEFKF
ncbi:MAG: hypothetical protein KKG99_13120 [Bacteroidetes bacterium]|nr:hypothetical protein [Bacteroidota bacterium]